MANVYAVKNGDWSDATTWNTGESPTAADDVYANGYTVTIDTSPTVLSLRASSGTGIVSGGTFVPLNGVTLTCTGLGIVAGGAVTNSVLSVSIAAGQIFNLVSNLTENGNSARHMTMTGAGTVYINGNVLSPVNVPSITNSSTGTIDVTGTVTGTNNNGQAIQNTSAGTVIVTGTVAGTTSLFDTIGYGINNSSIGTVLVTGSVIGQGSSPAVNNGSTGTMTIIGSAIGILGAAIAPGSATQNTFLTGPFIGSAQGVAANIATRWMWIQSVGSSYMTVPNSTATGYKNLYTADEPSSSSGQPGISSVRLGTVYGPSSEFTGTLAMPLPSQVYIGAPVDDTVGTAALNGADIWNYPMSGITTSGSIGERLKNIATINSVSQQISDAFSSTI